MLCMLRRMGPERYGGVHVARGPVWAKQVAWSVGLAGSNAGSSRPAVGILHESGAQKRLEDTLWSIERIEVCQVSFRGMQLPLSCVVRSSLRESGWRCGRVRHAQTEQCHYAVMGGAHGGWEGE